MHKFIVILTLSLPLLVLTQAHAQSITIIGGSSFARDCYTASNFVTHLNSASKTDIDNCNMAIQHGALKRRDLIATLVNRGILYASMEEYQRADKDYQKAIRLEPKSGEAFSNLGNLYFIDKEFISAINQYDKAISLETHKDHIVYYNRGMAWENLGDTEKAEIDYRQAMKLLPDWTTPQLRLERMLERAKELDNNG